MYQTKLVTYIYMCPQNASCIPKSSSSLPSPFPTNISYLFHISLNPPFPTQFSRHILSNVFHLTFYISVVFQKRKCYVVSVVPRVNYIYIFIKLQTLTRHIFPDVFTHWPCKVSPRHVNTQTPKHSGTEVMSS